jgi:hypothetical protein
VLAGDREVAASWPVGGLLGPVVDRQRGDYVRLPSFQGRVGVPRSRGQLGHGRTGAPGKPGRSVQVAGELVVHTGDCRSRAAADLDGDGTQVAQDAKRRLEQLAVGRVEVSGRGSTASGCRRGARPQGRRVILAGERAQQRCGVADSPASGRRSPGWWRSAGSRR